MNDTTIVVQGKIERGVTKDAVLAYGTAFPNVIVSIWDTCLLEEWAMNDMDVMNSLKNVAVVVSKFPSSEKLTDVASKSCSGFSTLVGGSYLQAITLKAGLALVKTTRVVKVRTDEFYSDLSPLVHAVKENPRKLVTCNIFAFPMNVFRYHMSDHAFCATTTTLKKAVDYWYECVHNNDAEKVASLKRYIDDAYDGMHAEQFLCCSFLIAARAPEDMEPWKITLKYFGIVPVTSLGSTYLFTYLHENARHTVTNQTYKKLRDSDINVNMMTKIQTMQDTVSDVEYIYWKIVRWIRVFTNQFNSCNWQIAVQLGLQMINSSKNMGALASSYYPYMHLNIGVSYYKLGEIDKALAMWEQVPKTSQHYDNAINNITFVKK
jgi:tetratricopeptide (TPR) repeat protein